MEWDEEKLAEISREVAKRGKKKEKEKLTDALGGLGGALGELYESAFRLNYFVDVKLDPSSGLKNGDEITSPPKPPKDLKRPTMLRSSSARTKLR